MERVLVMGSSGSGKSTFARRLSALTGIPMVSLDALYWRPGWIMDGNYTSHGAGDLRRRVADAVVWFDLPRTACMVGILTRIATSYGQVRPEMAPGCPEKIDGEFFRYVWTYRQRQRPKLLKYFEGLRPDQAFVCFTRRAQAEHYLTDVASTSIQASVH
jgi:adenylate kinase family enzyme